MISVDTNILFAAVDVANPDHGKARGFLESYGKSDRFCLCEQVLMELYCLLRNPKVCKRPLPAERAVAVIQRFRSHPAWRIVDVSMSPFFMNTVWEMAASPSFAYRRIFDVRLAMTLQHHGVTDFATCNLKDFSGLGFRRIWNPLVE